VQQRKLTNALQNMSYRRIRYESQSQITLSLMHEDEQTHCGSGRNSDAEVIRLKTMTQKT